MAFHLNAMIINKLPAQVTHTKDISIHFHTFRDSGVLFTTSKEANNDYIMAYVNGHVHVDLFFERAGDRCDLLIVTVFLPKFFFTKLFECQIRRILHIKVRWEGAYLFYHL